MKKIMFNDRYGLTEAVLTGRKTQTRRIVPPSTPLGCWTETVAKSRYQVDEVVAIAQSYKDAGVHFLPEEDEEFGCYDFPAEQTSGWTNKMFVRADLMPHRIRISNVRVERLQDISDEDCIKEGILHSDKYAMPYGIADNKAPNGVFFYYTTPREAYAALIGRISGKGTWESNPYVFVYDFELVK